MPVLPSEPKTRNWLLVVSAAVASVLALFAFDSFDSTIESSSSSNDSFETIVDHRITAMLELTELMHLAEGAAVQYSINVFVSGSIDLHVIRGLSP